MGACREGFDLFKTHGRRNFLRAHTHGRWPRWAWQHVGGDTFGRFACALLGHRVYDAGDPGGPPEHACKRCGQWLPKLDM